MKNLTQIFLMILFIGYSSASHSHALSIIDFQVQARTASVLNVNLTANSTDFEKDIPGFIAQSGLNNQKKGQMTQLLENHLQKSLFFSHGKMELVKYEIRAENRLFLQVLVSQDSNPSAETWSVKTEPNFGILQIRYKDLVGTDTFEVVASGDRSTEFSYQKQESSPKIFVKYLALGFTHIVPLGLDHILFIVALFLISLNALEMLKLATVFTLAHALTLAISALGVWHLSPQIVEPIIALSIAVVALEVFRPYGNQLIRYGTVFCFGLLHGLGFAGVLSELGLPHHHQILALISFNAGIEFGQIGVLITAALVSHLLVFYGMNRVKIYKWSAIGLASVAVFWTAERIFI